MQGQGLSTIREARKITLKDREGEDVPVKDINGIYVIDFEDPEAFKETEGIKVLEPIWGSKTNTASVAKYTDPESGITYGIPTGEFDDRGYPIFQKIKVNNQLTLNLARKSDRMKWEVIKNSPLVKGGWMEENEPVLKVYDEIGEARKNNEAIYSLAKAVDIVNEMDLQEKKEFASIFRADAHMQSNLIIENILLEKAKEDPKKFIDEYNGKNRDIKELFKQCCNIGVITNNPSQGFISKNGELLGTNENNAIDFLMSKPELTNILKREMDIVMKREISGKKEKKSDTTRTENEKKMNDLKDEQNKMKDPEYFKEKIREKNEEEAKKESEREQKEEDLPDRFEGYPIDKKDAKKDEENWTKQGLINFAKDNLGISTTDIKELEGLKKKNIVQELEIKMAYEDSSSEGTDGSEETGEGVEQGENEF